MFSVVNRSVVDQLFPGKAEVVDMVRQAYVDLLNMTYGHGGFLLDGKGNRYISAPCILTDEVSGLKWVSSFPGNLSQGLPRASAAVILNDHRNGVPKSLVHGSRISLERTAASACVAMQALAGNPQTVGLVGLGRLATVFFEYVLELSEDQTTFLVYDSDPLAITQFIEFALSEHEDRQVHIQAVDYRHLLKEADVCCFATNTSTYEFTLDPQNDKVVILHLSLRDLAVESLRDAWNVVDDVELALSHNTSLDEANKTLAAKDLQVKTLSGILAGESCVGPGPRIFSPFGLPVFDVMLAEYIYAQAKRKGLLHVVDF